METDRADVSSLYSAAVLVLGLFADPAFGWWWVFVLGSVVHLQVECAEEYTSAVGIQL